jgi:hypothetical protein
MSADKLMMLFCDMRNEILKEGILPAIAEISPGFIITATLASLAHHHLLKAKK